jgi:hypothetical protein
MRRTTLVTALVAGTCLTGTATAQQQPCPSPGVTGPDVIVGDVNGVSTWGSVAVGTDRIYAYSLGTTSCNLGTVWLNWFSNTNQHPVIGQNLFRLKTVDGSTRFEQVGQSWLKHGFFALSQSLCCNNCQPTDGTHLGIGCSDPYTSARNGSQSNLGPRSQVNAFTGAYPYPFSAPAAPATIGRRIQVHQADIDPAQNVGAIYFGEAMYVTPDDAAARNNFNNASYRRIASVGTDANRTLTFTSAFTTNRAKPGIQAWKDNDQSVTLRDVNIPSEGRVILGYRVTDLGNGRWHYEYAIQNLNSHRSVGSFSVPIANGVTTSNVGFHDVDSHSGEPYDLTDWARRRGELGPHLGHRPDL